MKFTVMVPTYRRTSDLKRCLEALKKQTRPADEVILVVRDSDEETWSFLDSFESAPLPLRIVKVEVPGQVAALNAGLQQVEGDVVSITDDDAAPHPHWLERIAEHFLADNTVGGVGGRDWVYQGTQLEDGKAEIVGRVQWFGRVIGNHHFGAGLPKEVDVLKGANMSYRKSAVEGLHFNQNLKGKGAQAHNDMAFSLAVKKRGWKLIYDPQVSVDHYPAQRFDEDQRQSFSPIALGNAIHNETLVLLEYLPPLQKLIFLLWAILIGTRAAFGVVQWIRFLPKEGHLATQKLGVCLSNRLAGWQSWCQGLGASTRMLQQ